MKKLLFIPLVVSTLVVSAQSLSRKAVLVKGQQLEQVVKIKMILSMEMMGQSISMNNDNTATSLIEVKNATGKEYAIESTIKRVVTNMNGMGQEMSYDSDKKEETANIMGQKIQEMVGKTRHLKVDTKGFITVSDDTTGSGITEKTGDIMSIANGISNTSNKAGSSYGLVADLPAKTLNTGDTWIDSTITKEGKAVTNYKVLSITAEEAVVDMTGTVSQSGETESNGMKINLVLNGTTKAQYTVEVATGIIKKRNSLMDGTGSMDVMGQSVPFTMKINMEEDISSKK